MQSWIVSTLLGKNEIQIDITRLFGRKKGSDKDDIGRAESENDDGRQKRQATKQSTPAIYKTFRRTRTTEPNDQTCRSTRQIQSCTELACKPN